MGYIEELRGIVGHRPLILVGSVTVISDGRNQILLEQRKQPNGVWGLPGGLMEPGESVEDTARREVQEETGLRLGNLDFIGVFSGSDYFVKMDNGDEFYSVTVAFQTSEFEGNLRINNQESLDISFFDAFHLPDMMVRSHKKIIQAFLQTKNF